MAATELMGWVSSMNRWQERYKGKLYTVSPRQLGAEPRTSVASRETANEKLKTAKQFIRGLWEIELISLPRNIEVLADHGEPPAEVAFCRSRPKSHSTASAV